MVLPLCSALVRPQLESWLQFWAPQDRCEATGERLTNGREGDEGLEHFPYTESLRDGMVDPGKEMAPRDLITVYKHLKAGSERTEPGQETVGTNRRFLLATVEHFCTAKASSVLAQVGQRLQCSPWSYAEAAYVWPWAPDQSFPA